MNNYKKWKRININGKVYFYRCIQSIESKYPKKDDYLGIRLLIEVRTEDGNRIEWKRIKNSYLAEKIEDKIQKTIND